MSVVVRLDFTAEQEAWLRMLAQWNGVSLGRMLEIAVRWQEITRGERGS